MIKTFNNSGKNNCFLVKHKAEDYVESVIIDTDKKEITIKYQWGILPPKEKEIIIEEYNKFGILLNSTIYNLTSIIKYEKDLITYSYK